MPRVHAGDSLGLVGTGHYSIGPRMWFIGATYVANHRVHEAASRTCGITVQLVEGSGRQTVVFFSSHSDDEITKATYGYHFPLHAGSKGQVLLAYSDPAFIDSYLSGDLECLTPLSETDPLGPERAVAHDPRAALRHHGRRRPDVHGLDGRSGVQPQGRGRGVRMLRHTQVGHARRQSARPAARKAPGDGTVDLAHSRLAPRNVRRTRYDRLVAPDPAILRRIMESSTAGQMNIPADPASKT